MTFEFKHYGKGVLRGLRGYNGRISASISQSDEVPYGGNFPIGKNLPDIKVTDFLKCICILTSTFPSQRFTDGRLAFADIVSLWEAKAQAVDWTKKLIPSEACNHPRQTDFSVEDYCQHNIYKWKEDDTVFRKHDADMEIDNKTLEYTQDVCTLPFAATDGNRIPIYEWESTKRTFGRTTLTVQTATKYKARKDRIVNLVLGFPANSITAILCAVLGRLMVYVVFAVIFVMSRKRLLLMSSVIAVSSLISIKMPSM